MNGETKQPRKQPVEKKDEKSEYMHVEKHFGGVIETIIDLHKGSIESRFTDQGQKKLESYTPVELFLYFSTILEVYQPEIIANLINVGPVIKIADFAAFKLLSEAVAKYLNKNLK